MWGLEERLIKSSGGAAKYFFWLIEFRRSRGLQVPCGSHIISGPQERRVLRDGELRL